MSENKEKARLFAEFEPVSSEKWKEKMLQDLKGVPFEKLVWKSNEGIGVKPFYTSEDLNDLAYLNSEPGEFPYLRGNRKAATGWEIRQDILVENVEKANFDALHALNGGATALGFVIPEGKTFSQGDFTRLLKDIYIDCIHINFLSHTGSSQLFDLLAAEVRNLKISPDRITGSIDNDPLAYLAKHGKFAHAEGDEFKITASLIKKSSDTLPNLKVLGVNGQVFHNAGGNIVQELGFCLAMISDYLDLLSKEGLKPEQIAKSMQLNLAVGPVYFMELAKIRAARLLFAKLAGSWGITDEDALKTFIHCTTSEWNQTVYDPYVNMLRSTTEGMSAVMAGCDSLTITPFDNAFRKPTDFSERIARNSQIILKEEAWLDKVQDPAAGAYFIENLTDSVVQESWKLFLEIEEKGGYLKAFKSGEIQKRIKASATQREINVASRKEILLGTNQYPNLLENKPEDFDPAKAFPLNKKQDNLLAEPLVAFRGSMPFEKLRLKMESNPKKVFLLTIGSPVWRKARAGFSASFFGCGGFAVIDNPGFDTIDEGLKAASSAQANIVVLCSSDEEYVTLAPETLTKLDKKMIMVVAGFPKDSIEDLKAKGITNFIHIKSNVLEELVKFQQALG